MAHSKGHKLGEQRLKLVVLDFAFSTGPVFMQLEFR